MNEIFKRGLSWLLAISMVWSMGLSNLIVPAAAAEEGNDPSQEETVETVTMTFDITNAILKDAEGNVISSGEYEAVAGTVLSLTAAPADGFELTSMIVDGITLIIDPEDTINITVKEGRTVTLTAEDVAAPSIIAVTRQQSGWVKAATYLVEATDNASVTSCTVTDAEGNVTVLADKDGGYTAIISANGVYTIEVKDAQGLSATYEITEDQIDTAAPVIVDLERLASGVVAESSYLLSVEDVDSGIAAVTVMVGEEEVTVTNESDGKYRFLISSGETYTITVTDAAGNEIKQTVVDNEIDIDAPVISELTRQESGWQAESANYTFAVTDAMSEVASVSVSINGGEEKTLTAQNGIYSFTAEENTTVTITVVDTLGNTASQDVTEAQIDKEAPVIGEISRVESSWAITPNYTFTATDSGSGVASVEIHGPDGSQTLTPSEDGQYQLTVDSDGEYTITVTDTVGRKTTASFTEEKVDKTGPDISEVVRSTNDWERTSQYSFTVEDNQSGVASVTVKIGENEAVTLTADEDGKYHFSMNSNGSFAIAATDTAGNLSLSSGSESKIDNDSPVIQSVTRGTEAWVQEAVYTVHVQDTASGLREVTVQVDDEEPVVLTPVSEGVYSFTASKNAVYTVTATDNLGITATETVEETKVDTTVPVLGELIRQESGWVQTANYTFTAEDAASGIAKVTVTIGTGDPVELTSEDNTYSFQVNVNEPICVTVTDIAGNVIDKTITESMTDNTCASISAPQRAEEGWATDTSYTFTVEENQSGIQQVTVQFEEEKADILTTEEGIYTFAVTRNGTYTVTVTDAVGNVSSCIVEETFIDTTNPVIEELTRQKADWQTDVAYTFTVKETQSGVASVTVKIGEADEQLLVADDQGVYRFTMAENEAFLITATDAVGNTSTVSGAEDRIDTEAPTKPVLTSSADEKWVNTDVTLTAVSSDSQSGVAAYWYSTDSDTFGIGSWTKMELTDVGTIVLAAEQNRTYYIAAEDGVGRVSEVSSIAVSIDKTAPAEIAVNYVEDKHVGFNSIESGNYIYNDLVGFVMTAKDPASGIVKYEYRIVSETSSTEWLGIETGVEQVSATVSNLPDDIYSVFVRVYDLAGNCSEEFTVMKDGEPVQHILENTPATDAQRGPAPEVALTTAEGVYSGNWTAETVTISVSGSSAVSGIDYYEYSIDYVDPAMTDIAWTTVPVINGTAQLTVSSDTNAVYSFRAVSYADNVSQVISRTVKVQKTAPKAAVLTPDTPTGTNNWHTKHPGYGVTLPEQGAYLAPVHYVITYTYQADANAEEQSFAPVIYDGTNAPKVNKDGYWNITFTATDAAGNTYTESASTAAFQVDTTTPYGFDVLLDGASILVGENGAATNAAWDQVLTSNSVSDTDFQIFKNQNGTITASADGGVSGLYAIYYLVSPVAGDWRNGSWTLLDGSLTLTPDSKNHIYFKAVDNAGNIHYFSGTSFILDRSVPVGNNSNGLTMVPRDTNRSSHGYYNGDVTVDIQVQEPMIGADEVFAGLQYVTYRVFADGYVTQSGQLYPGSGTVAQKDGRIQGWSGTLTVQAAANNTNHIIVEVTATDMAGNSKTTRIEDGVIRIDTDKPVMESQYDTNKSVVLFDGKPCFTGSRTLTVTVNERNFVAAESVITVKDTDTGTVLPYEWRSNGSVHSAAIEIKADGHYEISASVADAAGNHTTVMGFVEGSVGADAFIIDNTAPEITVSYDNNAANQSYYFQTGRVATIQVTERNFNPDNIVLSFLLEDETGNQKTVRISQWSSDGNVHTAYATCSQEGTYSVSVAGKDALGNPAKPTLYTGEAATYFVVDTHIDAPSITDVQNGSAYSGEISPKATVLDANLYKVSAKLLRTRLNEIGVDVTQEMLAGNIVWEILDGGKEAVLNVFQKDREIDGVYTLIITCEDKAGNTNETSVTFSVNRFGSVYVYEQALIDTMDGYFQKIGEDLIITEYNPSGLVAGSARVSITLDGTPITDPVYDVKPAPNGKEAPGKSGWYEYQYVISAENFTKDGIYEIVISTQDAAGNVPENTSEEMAIRFAVDNEAPSLTSISGLEELIYKADSISVDMTALDNVALESIIVYVDGKEVASWTEMDGYSAQESFIVGSGLEQHVRIVVTDKAGNILDTDDDSFSPGYLFVEEVTVSTNVFLRYYANKPLFFGSLGGSAALAILLLILAWKKKKKVA